MISRLKLITVALLACCTSLVYAASVQESTEDYIKTGKEIVDMVNSGSIDVSGVESRVLSLTKNSVALAQAYIKKYPQGEALLSEVMNHVAIVENGTVKGLGPMVNDSFARMEEHWHDLGFMEGKDFGVDMEDEDNEHFTDPLHVMIHPLMVLRAAKDGNKDAMKSEMEEGMEQIEITAGEI